MDVKIQAALIALIGGLVGGGVTAAVTHIFGLEASRQELLQTARRNAYVDWLQARQLGVRAERLREVDSAEAERLDMLYALEGWQTLGRIGVYGDPEVVKAVAAWIRTNEGSGPCTNPAWEQDISVYQSMRASLMQEERAISDTDLSDVIFGCSEPTK